MKNMMFGLVVLTILVVTSCVKSPYVEGSIRLVNQSDSDLSTVVIQSNPSTALGTSLETGLISPNQEIVFNFNSFQINSDGELSIEFVMDGTKQTIKFGYITPGMAGGNNVVTVLGQDSHTVEYYPPEY
jgi:hypothetical protein